MRIETPSLRGSISLAGGRIDDLVLAKYHETADPKSPSVEFFSPSGAPHPYYAEYGWVAGAGVTQPMPGRDTVWRAEKEAPLTPGSPVTLVWDNGQGLVFRRTIAVDADYLFTVTDEVQNNTAGEISAASLRADLAPRHAADIGLLHPARRPHRRDGRRRSAGSSWKITRDLLKDGRHQDLQADRRLARHHRQVLGRSADPRSDDGL